MEEKVFLNISGELFVTFASTLKRHPNTLLGSLSKDDPTFEPSTGQYFFDRNAKLFSNILDYYRHGTLHFSHCLCGPTVSEELEFWGISEDSVASCCWPTLKSFEDGKEIEEALERVIKGPEPTPQEKNDPSKWIKWKWKIFKFLEHPYSSVWAKVWSYLYIFLLVLSVTELCLETEPLFRTTADWPHERFENKTNPKIHMFLTTMPHPILDSINFFCTTFFLLELLVKFIVWPGKLNFFCQFFNIIDLLSVTPMLICAVIESVDRGFWFEKNLYIAYCVMAFIRVFRAIRILKLVRHCRGLNIIWLAVQASFREILLLLMLMMIGVLVFSTMIYYAEFSQEDTFETIPVGFWWAIVTMTTVGYGDTHPKTALGYVVGSICALMGVLSIGLPIPVIANKFQHYYKHASLKRARRLKKQNKNGALCNLNPRVDTISVDDRSSHSNNESVEIGCIL